MLNNTSDKRFSTEPLDDAMRELLDICQQYNVKCSKQPDPHNRAPPENRNISKKSFNIESSSGSQSIISTSKHQIISFPTMSKLTPNDKRTIVTDCDITNIKHEHSQANESSAFRLYNNTNMARVTTPGNHLISRGEDHSSSSESTDESVEKLQQRQGELQAQLDEVLTVAKSLEAKQKRKLTGIFEAEDNRAKFADSQNIDLDDDDDDELIEFQQIENELRISELKRQLSNIEEELRLRLYKRLLTKTTNCSKPSSRERHNTNNALTNTSDPSDTTVRRNSTQTDESTPPSSSCSDEQTATSSTSTSDTISSSSQKIAATSNSDRAQQSAILAREIEIDTAIRRFQLFDDWSQQSENQLRSQTENQHEATTLRADARSETKTNDLLSSALQDCHNQSDSQEEDIAHSMKLSTKTTSQIPTSTRKQRSQQIELAEPTAGDEVDNCVQNNYMNVNNDLERIDEGDEEDIEYYANSDVYRSIYEEKISPMIQAGYNSNNRNNNNNNSSSNDTMKHDNDNDQSHSSANSSSDNSIKKSPFEMGCFNSPTPNINMKDHRFNLSNVNSAKRGNRPLTLYMPKPDEDIDLKELIQSMGHDLAIMENDLSVSPSSAHGYLYKSCSSSPKKWLKRFFYFDRHGKTLSYYETEEQLVKKSSAPKCTIRFDDISDVYVDHRLSDLSEKQKDSKRRSCFVLSTTKRKYVLATPRAEIMRAWIDILFTAAKANDYFQAMNDENQEASFIGCLDSLPE